MNGWQRIWFVLTVGALVIFGVGWPYTEVYGNTGNYYFRQLLAKDLAEDRCSKYRTAPFKQLEEPPFDATGGGCWQLYLERKYSRYRDKPYSLAVYDQELAETQRERYMQAVAFSSGAILAVSALLYLVGLLVAWIRRGFVQQPG